jgi:diguanylate cyclase (GGDEF)-like protein/PAS domain S-box-containing protein
MDDDGSQKITLETLRHQALLDYGILDTPPEDAFDDLTSLVAQLLNAPIALITLADRDRLWIKSAYGYQGGTSPQENSLCNAALDAPGVTCINDLALDPHFCNKPQYSGIPAIRFYAGAPLVTPDGMPLGTLCVMDYVPRTLPPEQSRALMAMAKQVIAQMELRKERDGSRQSYRQLFVNSMDGVMLGRAEDGALFAINPAACAMLGRTEQELMDGGRKDFLDLNDPRIPKLFAKRAKNGFARGEMNFVRADGTPFEIEVSSVLYKGSDGKLLASTVFRDITARKKAEADLRIAASAFESQEGIFVSGADWRILKVNQAFTRQTGYSADEALGQQPHTLLGSDRTDAGLYSVIAHGLNRNGNWQGEVWDRRKSGEVYPVWLIITVLRNDSGEVTHYVATMTDITDRKAAEEEIRNLAFFDPLTSLPNRRLLMDRLGQALMSTTRIRRNGALLFLDLDNFKGLNDTLGHDMGDMLLKEVAKRLLACVREGDTVARLGGDEFVVMLPGLSEDLGIAKAQAALVGEKILDLLNQAYLLSGTVYRSTPSIGVTLFGEHNESKDELLKRADMAMYQAKAAGRNTLRFFDASMQAAVTQRMALENALRDALARREFTLYYQPQVDGEGTITGAEVLVRWNHPQRGLVSPAEFIPMAEETGVIIPMGRWILEGACRQLARWAVSPDKAHLTVAVNVSARQLMRSDFVDSVLLILRETGARPQCLKLELTESVLVSDVDNTIAKMRALKQRGVGFAMDDFGTGYSSLSFLKLLPLDQLKIDQGFVRDILIDVNDAAIAKMVIALADSLGLTVIAEGVETQAQREFLSAQGCFAYQGYLFGKPMQIAEFETLLIR